MHGDALFRPVYGEWQHYGTFTTEHVAVPPGGVTRKGTFLDFLDGDLSKATLSSGSVVGFTTQDIDETGHTDLGANLLREFLGNVADIPIRRGKPVSVRKLFVGGMFEIEGLGAAGPGNHVVTTGTGALDEDDVEGEELSCLMGSIRKAQAGDRVHFRLLKSNLTPEVTGNLRILCEVVSPYPL